MSERPPQHQIEAMTAYLTALADEGVENELDTTIDQMAAALDKLDINELWGVWDTMLHESSKLAFACQEPKVGLFDIKSLMMASFALSQKGDISEAIKRVNRNRNALTDDEKARILKLNTETDMTQKAIAKEVKRSRKTVNAYLNPKKKD